MSGLEELIARVEKATGPDRNLDALVCCVLKLYSPPWTNDGTELIPGPRGFVQFGKSGPSWSAPEFTASLDAVIGLVERELPEWRVTHAYWNNERAHFTLSRNTPSNFAHGDAPTPALALLLAFLKAKAEQSP